MEYNCTLTRGKRTYRWVSTIRVMKSNDPSYEVEITGRGSYFHAIIGSRAYGNYICIPNYSVGSELSYLDDVFWNRERLSGLMSPVDAATIANGLSHLKEAAQEPLLETT